MSTVESGNAHLKMVGRSSILMCLKAGDCCVDDDPESKPESGL